MTTTSHKPAMFPQVVLASASPRRAELLTQLGVHHRVAVVEIDETPRDGERAEDFVVRMARAKAAAVDVADGLPVVAADTAVVLDDSIFGKPRHREDGLTMLASLSGVTHAVMTGVAVRDKEINTALSISHVTFRAISQWEAEAYWASGEPVDKAGGYAIQGRAAVFVERLEGSYSGVVGLPLFETSQLLQQAGVDIWRPDCGA